MVSITASHSAPTSGSFKAFLNAHCWESGIGKLPCMSTRDVLAENLKALMAERADRSTLAKIIEASRGRLSNGKLGRIRSASHATDVDALGDLAKVFGMEPWQLLVPNLNPKALPRLADIGFVESLRSLLSAQSAQPEADSSETAPPSGKRKRLERLPGEVFRTGPDGGKLSEVNQSRAVPKKRGGRRT